MKDEDSSINNHELIVQEIFKEIHIKDRELSQKQIENTNSLMTTQSLMHSHFYKNEYDDHGMNDLNIARCRHQARQVFYQQKTIEYYDNADTYLESVYKNKIKESMRVKTLLRDQETCLINEDIRLYLSHHPLSKQLIPKNTIDSMKEIEYASINDKMKNNLQYKRIVSNLLMIDNIIEIDDLSPLNSEGSNSYRYDDNSNDELENISDDNDNDDDHHNNSF